MGLKTLNYSEIIGAFQSFMSSEPKWYLDFKDRYYSFDANNIIRLHNSNSIYNELSSGITTTSTATSIHPRWNASGGALIYGTDRFNLSLVPCGTRSNSDTYGGLGSDSRFWTSTVGTDPIKAYSVEAYSSYSYFTVAEDEKFYGHSVRVIRDATSAELLLSDGTILSDINSVAAVYIDYDLNEYGCVKIGTQIWTTHNLITTKYNDGSSITTGLVGAAWTTDTVGAYSIYVTPTDELTTPTLMKQAYGILYSWNAVNSANGIVNTTGGWRVPSKANVESLLSYIYTNYSQYTSLNVANAFKSTRQVSSPLSIITIDTPTPDNSYIRTIVNSDYKETKTFDNVSYSADFVSSNNFSNIYFETKTQISEVTPSPINKREDTYSLPIPRELVTIPTPAYYGDLYNWYAVNDSRNIAPTGWHVPTEAEFTTLIAYCGGTTVAGGILKEEGYLHWQYPNEGAVDTYGFRALPGGNRYTLGEYAAENIGGSWWSSTEYDASLAKYIAMDNYNDDAYFNQDPKHCGFSVRCIRDTGNPDIIVTDVDGNGYTSVTIGTQQWMVENLRTSKYRNGDTIPNVTSAGSWIALTSGATCSYDNEGAVVDSPIIIPSRVRGKYLVSNFTFQSTVGNYFTLPYIETTYRYSSI